MTAAMYASIAGLKSHMQKLSVIGNNVANVNTVGYKSQRALFKDSIYNMYASGSDGTTTMAGKNPSQIGYGSVVSTIDINMSSSTPISGNPWDTMISGDGFFLVGNKDLAGTIDATNPNSLKNLSLSRVGDISPKADGYFSDSNFGCIYGFQVVGVDMEGKPIVSDQLVPLRLPQMEKVIVDANTGRPPEGDQDIELDENGELPAGYKWSYTVHYPVAATRGDGDDAAPVTGADLLSEDVTQIAMQDYQDFVNNNRAEDQPEVSYSFVTMDGLSINSNGAITGKVKETGEEITIGYIALGNVTNPNGVTHTGGYYYNAGEGAGDLQVSLVGGMGKDLTIVGGSKLNYVNGSMVNLGDYDDYDSLEDLLSGKVQVGSAGETVFMPGCLESSNADLATEIAELITTQRGYQANTRIITVTDSMLEELVNMKR